MVLCLLQLRHGTDDDRCSRRAAGAAAANGGWARCLNGHPGASGAYRSEDLLLQDYQRVRQLCDRYADSDIGFVDAAVLAIVERLNEPSLATLDHRHFGMQRPQHVDALRLLPQ